MQRCSIARQKTELLACLLQGNQTDTVAPEPQLEDPDASNQAVLSTPQCVEGVQLLTGDATGNSTEPMGMPPNSCEGCTAEVEGQQMKQSRLGGQEEPGILAAPPQGPPPLEATSQSTLTVAPASLLEVVGHSDQPSIDWSWPCTSNCGSSAYMMGNTHSEAASTISAMPTSMLMWKLSARLPHRIVVHLIHES